MYVCMCVYAFTYVFTYAPLRTYIHICMCTYFFTYRSCDLEFRNSCSFGNANDAFKSPMTIFVQRKALCSRNGAISYCEILRKASMQHVYI